jgi:hypothetical protein
VGVRPPLRLLRLANPVVRAILRSPAHGLLSGSLAVLEYEGHKSGRTFAIPLRYAETGDGSRLVTVAVDPPRKLWWRAFTEPRTAVVLVRRRRRDVAGTLLDGPQRENAVAAYAARFPGSAGLLDHAAVVVFERAG